MTKQTLKLTAFGILTIALILMGVAYFSYSSSRSDLKIEVTTFNVAAPECNEHHRCAGINWGNVDGEKMTRSMGQPNNLDVKPLDYDALHKAGLWPR